jgi:NAD(P)H dehydrogenase (quinone)
MNVFIVFAHPSKNSFTFQILENLKKGLKEAGHTIEISDLYSMGFQSDLTEEEYKRESVAQINLPIPEDIRIEQQKIEESDCIIFVYPVWWSDCPAKLKGWFDRVYTVGYAYGYDNTGKAIRKMKKIKKGLVICTAGHPNDFLDETGISESMRNIMIDDRLGIRFDKNEMVILGGTLNIDKVKKNYLKRAYEIGKNI